VVAVTDLSRNRIVPLPKKGGAEPAPREKPSRNLRAAKAKAAPTSPTPEPSTPPASKTSPVVAPHAAPTVDQLSLHDMMVKVVSEDGVTVGANTGDLVAIAGDDPTLVLCPECHNVEPVDCVRCGGDGWVALAA
jgi:hypothetical protein